MKLKRTIIVSVMILGIVAAGINLWQIQHERANAAKSESEILKGLSGEEIAMILRTDKNALEASAASPEARQLFLKGMREYLALAAVARREGMAEDPAFKVNRQYKTNQLLAEQYSQKLVEESGKAYVVPEEEIAAVWDRPENERNFTEQMDVLRSIQLDAAAQKGFVAENLPLLAGGALEKARKNWARVRVLSERAKADGEFMGRQDIRLRLRVLEAGILSADYLRNKWAARIKPSEQEIKTFLVGHPEYDIAGKRQKAEAVLNRARSGENFDALAKEFSEDRGTKDKGGLYADLTKDAIWIEVENAALALKPGQIAPQLVETHTGFHIVKLDAKKQENGVPVKFSVRHILLQKNFPDPSHVNPEIPAPFLTPTEIATAAVELEKRNDLVREAIQSAEIELPNDFAVS